MIDGVLIVKSYTICDSFPEVDLIQDNQLFYKSISNEKALVTITTRAFLFYSK
jgi:hypothetical protein